MEILNIWVGGRKYLIKVMKCKIILEDTKCMWVMMREKMQIDSIKRKNIIRNLLEM
jgi:hypothetical protein